MRLSTGALAGVLAVGVAVVWAPALRGEFVWDDNWDIVRSERLHHLGAVVDVFGHNASWSANLQATAVATYRPLALATLAIDYRLYGLHPFGYHATSILLHVLATLAVFLALGRLVGDPVTAVALAFLFAVHPANAEAVAWINGRSEIIALGFGALAIWAAAARRWPVAFGALLGAMLGKETGVLFVPLAVAIGWIEKPGTRLRLSWPAPVTAFGALAAYLGLRTFALGPGAAPGGSLAKAVAALPAIWLRAAQLALLPFERSLVTLSSWLHALGPVERLAYLAASLALLGLGALLVYRRQLLAALGLAWWLGALVPAMFVAVMDFAWPGLARWLYIGLPGLILFVWFAGLRRLERRTRIACFAVAGVAWLALTERAIPIWQNDTDLYATMIEDSPEDAWAWRALGMDQLGMGQYEQAAKLFEEAASRDQTFEVHAAYALLAYTWTFLDRCDDAVALFAAHPPTPFVLSTRFADAAAGCYSRAGDRARARHFWQLCAPYEKSCAESLAKLPP